MSGYATGVEQTRRFIERVRPDESNVRVPTHEDTDEVLVVGPCYHDPEQMTVGMDGRRMSEFAALHDEGAVPCSACFDDQSGVGYPHPYLAPETYLPTVSEPQR